MLGAWYAAQRRLGVYYGDSAIWVRRGTFDALGGYRDLAIMDDYDFVRRLERRGRTACLPARPSGHDRLRRRTPEVEALEAVGVDLVDEDLRSLPRPAAGCGVDDAERVEERKDDVDDQQEERRW